MESLFYCLPVLPVMKLFLISNLNILPCNCFTPCPLQEGETIALSLPYASLSDIGKLLSCYPLITFSPKLNTPSSLHFSAYTLPCGPLIIFVTGLWTFFNFSTSNAEPRTAHVTHLCGEEELNLRGNHVGVYQSAISHFK